MKEAHVKSLREAYASLHEPESMQRLAEVYWIFIVCVGTLAIFGSVGYGMWQLFMPPQREVSDAVVGGRAAVFDKTELQKAVQELQKRQDEFNELMTK